MFVCLFSPTEVIKHQKPCQIQSFVGSRTWTIISFSRLLSAGLLRFLATVNINKYSLLKGVLSYCPLKVNRYVSQQAIKGS